MAKKKNSSPKATKAKTDGSKKIVVTPPTLVIKLVSYTVRATIPTMMYGNIQPEITVEARTMEDAKLAVFPHIEELYQTYCEEPRDGRKPAFMSRASVTATERIVPQTPVAPAQKTAPVEVPGKQTTPPTPQAIAQAPEEPKTELDAFAEDLKKSPAYTKAEGAIKGAMSLDALNLIENQIQASVKLTKEEKPSLLTEVLKKRKEFN